MIVRKPAVRVTGAAFRSQCITTLCRVRITLFFLFAVFASGASAQVITTVAGGGTNGDGHPGIQAAINFPLGIARDSSGNVYFSEDNNHRVRKLSPAGIISTVAGNGISGFGGDGGDATSASLRNPVGVAVDANGNLYIADAGNARIRKVSSDGKISTFAGNGEVIFQGEGVAVNTAIGNVDGVAVDALGNVFFGGAFRVFKVAASGMLTTVAGNGSIQFSGDGGPAIDAGMGPPFGMTIDSSGNLYFVDRLHSRVRKVATDGTIATVAGNGVDDFSGDGGPATNASINLATDVATDDMGNIYIADRFNARIRKVNSNGIVSTIAGNGVVGDGGDGSNAVDASLSNVTKVTFSSGELYLSDSGNNRVRKISAGGIIQTIAGTGSSTFGGDGGMATDALLNNPQGLAVDANGNIFVADTLNHRIRKIDSNGIVNTIAGNGIADFGGDGGSAMNASLHLPRGLAINGSGDLFFADSGNNRIRKISASGVISTVAGNGVPETGTSGDGGQATNASINFPLQVSLDATGNLFIAETGNPGNRIRKVTVDGVISALAGVSSQISGPSADGIPAISTQLSGLTDIAPSASDQLYFANGTRIREILSSGIVCTLVNGLSGIAGPSGIALDGRGNIFFSDASHRILQLSSIGSVTTVAGAGIWGFSGDGGDPKAALLANPTQIVMDGVGNLFFIDSGNNRVRKISAAAPAFSWTGTVSRKKHGAGCEYLLPLDSTQTITGNVTVEPRSTGNKHLLVFQFSGPVFNAGNVAVTDADGVAVGQATAAAVGNTVEVSLAQIPDNQRLQVALTGVNGIANAAVSMAFLVGDINSSRAVNAADLSAIKAHSIQSVSGRNFLFDLDVSGAIDAADVSMAKAQSGKKNTH